MAMKRPFYIKMNLDSEIKSAMADISRYDASTAKKLRQAVKAGTRDTMASAKRNIHIRTGNLIRNVGMTYDERRNIGRVQSKARHSHLIEFGAGASFTIPTNKRALHWGNSFSMTAEIPERKPRPFMNPAIEKNAPRIEQKVREALKP